MSSNIKINLAAQLKLFPLTLDINQTFNNVTPKISLICLQISELWANSKQFHFHLIIYKSSKCVRRRHAVTETEAEMLLAQNMADQQNGGAMAEARAKLSCTAYAKSKRKNCAKKQKTV